MSDIFDCILNYGWAIMLILIIFAVLVYCGVIDISKFEQQSITVDRAVLDDYANLKCQQLQYETKIDIEQDCNSDVCIYADIDLFKTIKKNFTSGHMLNSTHIECFDIKNADALTISLKEVKKNYPELIIYSQIFSIEELLE